MSATEEPVSEGTSLGELARLFGRLGATAFGGPAAHIAMMREEVVVRRRWLSEAAFVDLLAATNLIPGPNSTEMALHIGWARRGGAGLAVAGLAFIAPAAAITGLCAWAYVRYGAAPAAGWLLYGVKPVVLAVVVQAIVGLARGAARTLRTRTIAGLSALMFAAGVHELAVLLTAGLVALAAGRVRARGAASWAPLLALGPAAGAAAQGLTLPGLAWVFFKTGAVLYGSGYVLVALLRAELVERLGWLSEAQLLDAVAVGQVTPGPVFTTATFLGYVLAGPAGAAAATAAIFAPAFALVAASGPLVPRLRGSPTASAILDGVGAASLALMAVVVVQLGRAALVDVWSAAIGLVGAALLLGPRVSSTWLVLGGAAAGWGVHALGLV